MCKLASNYLINLFLENIKFGSDYAFNLEKHISIGIDVTNGLGTLDKKFTNAWLHKVVNILNCPNKSQ